MSLRNIPGAELKRWQRTMLLLASLGLLAGFAAACWVKPDPNGYGTHQQFGLPPCTFRWIFGIPCPSCGGTTSFAHFVRGEWAQSLQTNVAGFALAACCAVAIPWAWGSCALGRSLFITSPERALLWIMIGLSIIALLQWGVRIGLSSGSVLAG